MAKKVTVIRGTVSTQNVPERPKLKVCGYARVSTGNRAQAESYATQVEYYTRKIEENPLWEFAGVYADEAATGTKVKGRDEFQTMMEACEDGDIDLILTKSITRFARNTVECIQTATGQNKWYDTVIMKMLRNEKYMGDALLQKTYTVDFMTKKKVINNGIVPQYYVEDDHEPIIPKELFFRVQEEIMRGPPCANRQ